MATSILKVIICAIVISAGLLWLHNRLGYERTELIAFGVLIGFSCASLKSH